MAKSEIHAGICGFKTVVETRTDGSNCAITIQSDCEAIQRLGAELQSVDPFREIAHQGEAPLSLEIGAKYCIHAACPVPVGIIKAIEVEAGLALPADAVIKVSKSGG